MPSPVEGRASCRGGCGRAHVRISRGRRSKTEDDMAGRGQREGPKPVASDLRAQLRRFENRMGLIVSPVGDVNGERAFDDDLVVRILFCAYERDLCREPKLTTLREDHAQWRRASLFNTVVGRKTGSSLPNRSESSSSLFT